MPKHQTKSQQVAAKRWNPRTPGVFEQHQNVQHPKLMGILTEDEIRNPSFYTEHYRCKNQAMERDLMQVQAASKEMLRARLQNQETFPNLASQTSMIVQLLNRPEVQLPENLKSFLPRYQRLHEEAKDMARPVLDVLNEEMPQTVQAMNLKDVQVSMQAQLPNGEQEDFQVVSQDRKSVV